MFKRFTCVITVLVLIFCLSLSNFAGVVAVADDETYLEITSKSNVLTSGTYKLTSDVTLNNPLQVNSGVEVTIDLCGYSLKCSGNQVILVNGGTLNLMDSSESGTGTVKNTSTSTSASKSGIKISNGGTLNMSGGTVSGTYGIYSVSNNCSINITGGSVIATGQVGIYYIPTGSDEGSITISGTDTVVITTLGDDAKDYGIYCTNKITLTISNPNTYVSASLASKAVYAPSSSRVTITAGHYSSAINSSYIPEGYSYTETEEGFVVTSDISPEFYGKALTLDGEIGVTYYFTMDGVMNISDYKLYATIDGETAETVTAETKTLSDGVTYYRYTVYVKPTQISSGIVAYLSDGSNKVDAGTYSVYEYCEYAINASGVEWEEVEDLCEAVLNYGYYAQVWYNNSESTLQSSIRSLDSAWTDPTSSFNLSSLSGYATTSDGIKKTLALDGGVYIRIYVTDTSATYSVDGETLEVEADGNGSYVEFKVYAKEMYKTFTVLKGDEVYTSYSIYTYIYNVCNSEISGDITESLQNLCKAIYDYGEEAKAYNNWI
ncbi:MAG: hypothetical protein LUH18_06040 [Oscillospiraceae bacterium]|nr:hypothetical protein [Oscillospiraceae bacterium]